MPRTPPDERPLPQPWPATRAELVVGQTYQLPYGYDHPSRDILRDGDRFYYYWTVFNRRAAATTDAGPVVWCSDEHCFYSEDLGLGRSTFSGDGDRIRILSLADQPTQEGTPMPTTAPPLETPSTTNRITPNRSSLVLNQRIVGGYPHSQQLNYFLTGDRIIYHRPNTGDAEREFDRDTGKWRAAGSASPGTYRCERFDITVTHLVASTSNPLTATPNTPPPTVVDTTPILRVSHPANSWVAPASPPTTAEIEAAADAMLPIIWRTNTETPIAYAREWGLWLESQRRLDALIADHIVGNTIRPSSTRPLREAVAALNTQTSDVYQRLGAFAGVVGSNLSGHGFAAPPRDRLIQQLTEISLLPGARIGRESLSFTTLPIVLEGRNFGRFLVNLNYDILRRNNLSTNSYVLTPLEPYYMRVPGLTGFSQSFPHPNVNTGRLCFGSSDSVVTNLLGNGFIAAASYYVETCLATGYRDQNPYQKYYNWPIARQPNAMPEGSPPPTHPHALQAYAYTSRTNLTIGNLCNLTDLDPETGIRRPLPTPTPRPGNGPLTSTTATSTGSWVGPLPAGVLPPSPTTPPGYQVCSISHNQFNPTINPGNGGQTEDGEWLCITHGYLCNACLRWHPRTA